MGTLATVIIIVLIYLHWKVFIKISMTTETDLDPLVLHGTRNLAKDLARSRSHGEENNQTARTEH